jgi:outer membrane protein assembly factor BamB
MILSFLSMAAGGRHRAFADDWPQWRGPGRNAVSGEVGLLRSWPAGGPKLVWQASGLGAGYSSVVVSHGRVFTIGKEESTVVVTALNAATGQPEWTRQIGTTARTPCSTPTVDHERLYALDPDGDLVCLKSDSGEVIWQKSFLDDFGGRMMSGRGFGESPLVDREKLICTPGGAEAALVALDKHTGATLWKSRLPDLGSAGKDGAGFSSIVVSEAVGIRQYVQLTGRGLVGVAADDGRFLWGYNAIANDTANIPTPVVCGDRVFAANGYNAGSVLLHLLPDESEGVTAHGVKARIVYSLSGSQFQNHHGGVVLVGDHLFGGHGSNNGLPTCVELQTGRLLWKRRAPGVGSAAVVYADGHLYFRFQNGVVALIDASASGYTLKGSLQVPGAGGDSWAHPVVANGRLYLREHDVLLVYDLRRDTETAPPADPNLPRPVRDADLTALQRLGISIEPLFSRSSGRAATESSQSAFSAPPAERTESEKARPIYKHTNPAEGTDESGPTMTVVLTDKHLTPDGTFPEELFGHLQNLRMPLVVSLAGTHVHDAGLKQLRNLKRIVGLDLELCGDVTDEGLEALLQLQHLRVLILTGTTVTQAGIRKLALHKTIAAIDLEVCDGITDAACASLSEMHQLKALVLKKTGFEPQRISDVGLRHLGKLSQLESLNLYGNKVTDAGLVHLEELTELRELDLSLLAISDLGLTHLQPLHRLQELKLLYSEGFAGPVITNAGMESLKSLTSLNSLNLTGARVTDGGLERLTGLKSLQTLQLVDTGVTVAGIHLLKTAIPGCRVIK